RPPTTPDWHISCSHPRPKGTSRYLGLAVAMPIPHWCQVSGVRDQESVVSGPSSIVHRPPDPRPPPPERSVTVTATQPSSQHTSPPHAIVGVFKDRDNTARAIHDL